MWRFLNPPSSQPLKWAMIDRKNKERNLHFAKAWKTNKKTYLAISGFLFLIYVYIFIEAIISLYTVDHGTRVIGKVTKTYTGKSYRGGWSTTIIFTYEENGQTKKAEIHIPAKNYNNLTIGSVIPVLKNEKTGLLVIPVKWPYYYNLFASVLAGLFSLIPYYYNFFVYKKIVLKMGDD